MKLSDAQWRLVDEALENAGDDEHTHAIIFAAGAHWMQEQAAKACDTIKTERVEVGERSYGCEECAEAIRAIKLGE